MKKRNQFLLTGIKFLVSSFSVALLGVGIGNYVKNSQPLLVEAAVICQSVNDNFKQSVDNTFINTNSIVQPIVSKEYTYIMASETIMPPCENTMNVLFEDHYRRMKKITIINLLESPRVTHIFYSRRLRPDLETVNTS